MVNQADSINLSRARRGSRGGAVVHCTTYYSYTQLVFTLPLSCDHRLAMYNNKYVLTSRPSFYLVVPRYFRVDFKFALFCHRISHYVLRCFTNLTTRNIPSKIVDNDIIGQSITKRMF